MAFKPVCCCVLTYKNFYFQPNYGRQSSSGSTHNKVGVQSAADSAPAAVMSAHSQALLVQKVKESSEAVNRGDFRTAIHLYSEAITLDPTHHILYTNRSAAYAKIQQFQKSLLDARKARDLNPKWAKVSGVRKNPCSYDYGFVTSAYNAIFVNRIHVFLNIMSIYCLSFFYV